MTMITRSQSKKKFQNFVKNEENEKNKEVYCKKIVNIEFEVNIDFNEASREWKKNKISIGNGQYKYKTICE